MDVLCVGMYRACSTWQYEVVAHLVERHRGGRRLGYLTGEQYEARSRTLGADEGWTVLKSHEGHPSFTRAIRAGRAIAVTTHRDLRDVVFSLMHKRGLTYEALLDQGMIRQVLANDRFWRRQPQPIIHQPYEQLVLDPSTGIAELADYLGIDLEPGEADDLAAEYSFEANRARANRLAARIERQIGDLSRPEFAQVYDATTLLHWNHLRQGNVGDWRTLATPRQIVALKWIGRGWLRKHGYRVEPSGNLASMTRTERVRLAIQIAKGDLVCGLRCLALRFPRLAGIVKRLASIPVDTPLPRGAAPLTPQVNRVDRPQRIASPHGVGSLGKIRA